MRHPTTKLRDLTQIQINPELPEQERLQRFVSEVGNPYQFRIGGTIVNIRYSNHSGTLQERLTRLVSK